MRAVRSRVCRKGMPRGKREADRVRWMTVGVSLVLLASIAAPATHTQLASKKKNLLCVFQSRPTSVPLFSVKHTVLTRPEFFFLHITFRIVPLRVNRIKIPIMDRSCT